MKSLVSMARKPEIPKEESYLTTSVSQYPYGLCLCLQNEDLERLGMTDLPEAGDMIILNAIAKVTSVSSRESEDSPPDRRVELQITHLGVDDEQPGEDD